ncbi:MAG: transcription termination/antitermination NusG family protein [Nitrospirota bacterium]
MNWHAIYTKPRNEDSVASRLHDIGIDVLNPKLKSKKYKRNKLIEVIEPLFPCYLFANFDKDKYSHLISYTRGVRYIVGKNNPIIVQDKIINTIKENMEEGNIIVIKPQRFEKGNRVLIKNGPFKDFYGIFERETKGSERVLILLDAIYYRLELDSWFLTKI